MILLEMEGMKLVHAAHDDHTVTTRTLLSTTEAQTLINYQDTSGVTWSDLEWVCVRHETPHWSSL